MKKRGASTPLLIGVLIVGLLIGAGITYVAAPSLGISGTSGLCSGQTITIGALNDLSDGLSAQGAGTQAAENLAIQDVNQYMSTSGCNLNFKLNSQDYKQDNPTALSIFQTFHSDGIQVVIGPLNSGTTAALLSTANTDHMVMISPSSTSPQLAIANDYLFRTVPSDDAQGHSDAVELLAMGAKAVVIVNRDDTYGNGLANATASWLKHIDPSIVIGGPTKYDPNTSDFTATINTMASQFSSLSNQVGGANNVAIYIVAFQEYGAILSQAHSQAPQLLSTKIPWVGMDGIAQNSDLTNSSSTVATYASQVGVYSTLFGLLTNNTKAIDFYNRIAGTSAGAAILGGGAFYDFEGYDDVWLAALSILSAGTDSGPAIKAILPSVAANFYGLTGPETLNAAGDRALFPGAGYQIWKVVTTTSGSWEWVLAGVVDYNYQVTWTAGNAPA